MMLERVKRANVTPVFKADATDVVENYRSISLLPIPSKCQERIVHNAVHSHVAPYLTDWQLGFVRGRSCATQLDRVAHNILLHNWCDFGIYDPVRF